MSGHRCASDSGPVFPDPASRATIARHPCVRGVPTFTGIPFAALDFYEALEADNSRSFWAEHKQEYEESVKLPVQELIAALAKEFGPGKMFRPYRDVRFATDKTPYKTHQGVWFGDSGTYFQISAAGLYLGGGHWRSDSAQVARLRRAVDDERHGPVLAKATTSLRRRGWEIGGEQLTRVPSGYPKDHPRADLLRHKTLTAGRDVGAPEWLETPAAAAEIAGHWRQLRPLVGWLHDHLG